MWRVLAHRSSIPEILLWWLLFSCYDILTLDDRSPWWHSRMTSTTSDLSCHMCSCQCGRHTWARLGTRQLLRKQKSFLIPTIVRQLLRKQISLNHFMWHTIWYTGGWRVDPETHSSLRDAENGFQYIDWQLVQTGQSRRSSEAIKWKWKLNGRNERRIPGCCPN